MRLALVVATLLVTAGCGGSGVAREPECDDGSAACAVPMLTVEQAVQLEAERTASVRGALVAEGGRIRLCAALAESYPPQCGRPSLVVEGLDLKAVEGLQHAAGVSWREDVSLNGTVAGGVLRVSG